MTPVPQQNSSDCTRAALASLLDMAYENVSTVSGTEHIDVYNRAVWEFLERNGLFRIDLPLDVFGKVLAWPGRTHCLVTVKSIRFPDKQHHVVGELACVRKGDSWEWEAKVVHDPARQFYTDRQLEIPYEVISVDLVFRRL